VKKREVSMQGYSSRLSLGNRVGRIAWQMVHGFLFRPSPAPLFGWRNALLRLFGAKIGRGVHIYPSVKIWAPWNLVMGDFSCLASWVDCYSVAKISLGDHATVSQYSYLCAATHDYEDPSHRLMPGPIQIGKGAWVAADVFVGPNVSIGEGAVVGARASVFKDIKPWTVAVGNPARALKKRALKGARAEN
jgi:putative colanic acid biosynthesis acetyltransferase WcaF